MFLVNMCKILSKFTLFISLLVFCAGPVQASDLTQRDWLVALTDAAGWLYGLPDEPQDPDYINILTGNRTFRFEAEDSYDPDRDNVSVMSFRNFGDFSGKGWLNGSRVALDTHLGFNLPISGEYKVVARVREPGHIFRIGEETVVVDAGGKFTETFLGRFYFDAGPHEIIATLPAGGSIDYISLTAPSHAIIAPPGGWDPDASLTWTDINTTLLQIFNLADIFPMSNEWHVLEAENYPQPGTRVTSKSYLGRPSAGKWLRAGVQSAQVELPLQGIQDGFYNMTLRLLGEDITIVIGDHHTIRLAGKAYLDDYTLPALYFTGSENNITIDLPPNGGIDQLVLAENKVELAKIATLFNLPQDNPPTAADLDLITSILAAFGVER